MIYVYEINVTHNATEYGSRYTAQLCRSRAGLNCYQIADLRVDLIFTQNNDMPKHERETTGAETEP